MAIAPPDAPLTPKVDTMQRDAEVMDVVAKEKQPKQPDIAKIKKQLEEAITKNNIDPNKIVRAGDFAYKILQNPQSWKQVTQEAIQEGVATPQDLEQEPTRDELVQVYASAQVVKKLILGAKKNV
jgi:ABC-type transport system substrate-binding protein